MPHIPFFYLENTEYLNEDDSHHFLNVLRKKEGDSLKVCDGEGNIWLAEAKKIKNERVEIEKVSFLQKKIKPEVSIASAIPKGQRMAFLVEKTSEIGVDKIYPLITNYSSVREVTEGMIRRMNAIARSACMQSEKGFITKVEKPLSLNEAIEKLENIGILELSGIKDNWRIFKETGKVLFVGPEGGWSEDEIKLFKEKNLTFLPLTDEPLRVETAAIVGLSFYYSLKF